MVLRKKTLIKEKGKENETKRTMKRDMKWKQEQLNKTYTKKMHPTQKQKGYDTKTKR